MNKPRFQTSLSLSKEDADLVSKLNKKGIRTIDIFRAGINLVATKLKVK